MTVLQELLNLGLVDIGSDDSRFAKMQSAAEALREHFDESPRLLITATLLALDEDVEEDDPFYEFVEGLVIHEWNTLRNTHVNRPRQLLRSITIQALASSIDGMPEKCGIVWNTAAPRLHHNQLQLGKASRIIERLLRGAFETAEGEAVRRAGMEPSSANRPKKEEPSLIEAPILNEPLTDDDLRDDVARAAGPEYPQGQALKKPNPHWPNSAPHWSFEFTPRMTAALVKAVNLGTSKVAQSMTALKEYVLQQLSELEERQGHQSTSSRMRLDVLWWSHARYSPSLKQAYEQLPAAAAALIAAIDLTTLVPPLAPTSVAHVLSETVASCTSVDKKSVAEFFAQLKAATPAFCHTLSICETSSVRVPLVELAVEAASGTEIAVDALSSRAGVAPDLLLKPAQLAMWMFRELQAHRLVEELS